MFNINQFRTEIVQYSLKLVNLYSPEAEEILVITCANESLGGSFLRQYPIGPALGIFQMEKNTVDDIWINFLAYRDALKYKILSVLNLSIKPPNEMLIYNLLYATIMARVFYLRVKEPIPEATNIPALIAFYKKFYNTEKGAANVSDALSNYNRFIGNKK